MFVLGNKVYNEYISIKPGKLVTYARPEYSTNRRSQLPFTRSKEEQDKQNRARKRNRLVSALTLLYDSATVKKVRSKKHGQSFNFKCTFVTLTIPSTLSITDNDLHYKVFAPFIRRWKQKEKGLLYVWKREVTKKGTVHYHLLTNAFFHHRELRNLWNYSIKEGTGYDNNDHNSTDIHSLKKARDPISYMAKYMTKDEDGKRVIDGKVWGCSKVLEGEHKQVFEEPDIQIKAELKYIGFKYKTTKRYDYCWVTRFDRKWLKICPNLKAAYDRMLANLIAINLSVNHNDLEV